MSVNTRRFATTMLGITAFTASAASLACSLEAVDPGRIKQLMAGEIAHRLGVPVARIPLSAISPPQLHTPFPLEADCSGVGALHHSAGFRWEETQRTEPEPVPGPPRSSGAQQCAYEGVAVLLGYDYSSPVAIHFNRRCR